MRSHEDFPDRFTRRCSLVFVVRPLCSPTPFVFPHSFSQAFSTAFPSVFPVRFILYFQCRSEFLSTFSRYPTHPLIRGDISCRLTRSDNRKTEDPNVPIFYYSTFGVVTFINDDTHDCFCCLFVCFYLFYLSDSTFLL